MITKIKTILRTVLLLPLHIFNKLSIFYSKFVNLIDPNGSECYWEELSQKQIDNRIGSSLKFRHEEYKPKICDLGLASSSTSQEVNMGTPGYTPPEYIDKSNISLPKRDAKAWDIFVIIL